MLRQFNPKAIAVSGLAAGLAFVVVLAADLRLTGRNVDDLIILGRPLVNNPAHARLAGVAVHAVNSLALAGVYAAVERRIPGPAWWKGIVFANVENVILYPLTRFEDMHPAIRDGQVDRYYTWPAFWQSVPRHIAYGAVLGLVFEHLTQREASASLDTPRCREAHSIE
ncbi:MAG: hypothetical protein H0T18_09415 [Chloroflexia bacterium]|nr:hypothetical protein [Chloroflexia bacterium]